VKTPNRLAVALHLRDLEPKTFPMAKAAGIEPPQLELRYADGLTRAEAKALYQWGLRVPGWSGRWRTGRMPTTAR
jgi:hypothetical protein